MYWFHFLVFINKYRLLTMRYFYLRAVNLFLLCFIITGLNSLYGQGFLHTSGKIIVDGSGNEILLRGMGLGGWLVQEGYMFGTADFANSPSEIRKKVEQLIGATAAEQYYQTYRNNFVQRGDIQQLAAWGFNSLRLPMHYNLMTPKGQPGVFIETGFAIIDSLLQWCKENKIYLILDLHCAPGGQNSANISDYDANFPSLWQSETNKLSTIALWRRIAERYKNETWIGGYDLLNETVWDFGGNNQPLRDLYISITNSIRQVDTSHIIFIEGNNWANDFTTLSPAWDKNMAYSFHKYWNDNSAGSIQGFINLRNSTNCPLWCGESGENSNQWFADAINLFETNKIGWSWWTIKKLESTSSLWSINKPKEYDALLKYWAGQSSAPTAAYAVNALNIFSLKTTLAACKVNKDVVDALFRMPATTATIPYIQTSLPGMIYAVNYDMGQNNYAYKDNDYQNINGSVYNSGYSFRNDGVDIEACSDVFSNGYNVGWITSGEFLSFTVNVTKPGIYKADFRISSASSGGMILVRCDNNVCSKILNVTNTGGWQSWNSITLDSVALPQGTHVITFQFLSGNFNFNYVEFTYLRPNDVEAGKNKLTYDISQNYPNPFNPETVIKYSIPEASKVELNVYNLLGQHVASLISKEQEAGSYSIPFKAGGMPAGTYFYTFKAGNYSKTTKMLLIK
jgi:aryl-phospho-beta-D-glucosidase BglC (GH1 family)